MAAPVTKRAIALTIRLTMTALSPVKKMNGDTGLNCERP
jgi:hypothetical protein